MNKKRGERERDDVKGAIGKKEKEKEKSERRKRR